MEKSWIADDGNDVGNEIENDIGGGEDQGAGLHHGNVAIADGVDHGLPDTRIDEHHFYDHHTGDQIGKIDGCLPEWLSA